MEHGRMGLLSAVILNGRVEHGGRLVFLGRVSF